MWDKTVQLLQKLLHTGFFFFFGHHLFYIHMVFEIIIITSAVKKVLWYTVLQVVRMLRHVAATVMVTLLRKIKQPDEVTSVLFAKLQDHDIVVAGDHELCV